MRLILGEFEYRFTESNPQNKDCAMGEFRISPALKIGQECFNTRKIRNCKGRVCEGYYLVSLKDCMMLSKKDDEGIREKFWNYEY